MEVNLDRTFLDDLVEDLVEVLLPILGEVEEDDPDDAFDELRC